MNTAAKLTPREREIAELLAWGAAKKEVAARLYISTRTVENTAKNIYAKLQIQKATELTVWWFCTSFRISFDLSPLKRQVIAVIMLVILIPSEVFANNFFCRLGRANRTEIRATRRAGRKPLEFDFLDFYL